VVDRDRLVAEAPTKLYEQTITRLAARTNVLGDTCIITDGTRPNVPVYYNGTVWKYYSDDVTVS